jgi:hypothetical protein
MDAILMGAFVSATFAVIGLLWKEVNRKINGKVNQELCGERSHAISRQLLRQEEILLRAEQRLISIEKKVAYLNGERANAFDHN